jgi:hypothetical protein
MCSHPQCFASGPASRNVPAGVNTPAGGKAEAAGMERIVHYQWSVVSQGSPPQMTLTTDN